jgi:Outer membrane protein beta-barrel domain
MKRLIWLPAVLCILFCSTARAQDAPEWEVSGGYTYVRANVTGSGKSFALNGGVGSITQNVNGWFGGRVQAGFFTGKEAGRTVSAQTITYGPVFSTHKYERITPFVDVQLGAIHGGIGYLGISAPAFRFTAAPGIGADFKVNDRVAIRVQADYLMTRFLGLRQDNLQGIVGLVLRLGRK